MLQTLVAAGALALAADSTPLRPTPLMIAEPVGVHALADTTPRPRRKSVEISEAYETRLTIHKWASYATLPIFAAQAVVGQQLFTDYKNGVLPSDGLRNTHRAIAYSLGGLFAVNTVTGTLNWWETRHQPKGRTWRTIHAALMLASDAGFAYTASIGDPGKFSQAAREKHRNWATGSAAVALASYVMMWSPIRRD